MLNHLASAIVALFLLVVPISSWAKSTVSARTIPDPVPAHQAMGSCTLGANATVAFVLGDFVAPPDDQYYTLLEPSTCSGCGEDPIRITAVKIAIYFNALCAQPIEVSVVGTTGDPGCPTPDPTNVLCPAAPYVLEGELGVNVISLPLETQCCISEPAFLCITFDAFGEGCSDVGARPELIAGLPNECEPCLSWNFYPGSAYDFCEFAAGQVGPFVHYVDTHCCGALDVGQAPGPSLRFFPPVPNPSAREFNIAFELARPGRVAIDILDLSGRTVRRLDPGTRFEAGFASRVWDARGEEGRPLPAGLYFVRLRVGGEQQLRKVALLP